MPRDQIYDAAACRKKASELATEQGIEETICGICIFACPWTQRYLRRNGVAPLWERSATQKHHLKGTCS
jgi:epoxyqueuosine reductase QueG